MPGSAQFVLEAGNAVPTPEDLVLEVVLVLLEPLASLRQRPHLPSSGAAIGDGVPRLRPRLHRLRLKVLLLALVGLAEPLQALHLELSFAQLVLVVLRVLLLLGKLHSERNALLAALGHGVQEPRRNVLPACRGQLPRPHVKSGPEGVDLRFLRALHLLRSQQPALGSVYHLFHPLGLCLEDLPVLQHLRHALLRVDLGLELAAVRLVAHQLRLQLIALHPKVLHRALGYPQLLVLGGQRRPHSLELFSEL
mmetsp:Transcript_32138/g.91171  ORF Transcript_32138/g.91171 Transcript_32138/m.91171 type:complete len:251 (-) Transcript_32138:364-1116(-)